MRVDEIHGGTGTEETGIHDCNIIDKPKSRHVVFVGSGGERVAVVSGRVASR